MTKFAHRNAGMLLGCLTASAYAVVAIAANFTTKYATQLLPGAPDVVLCAQLLVMLAAMHAARLLGIVRLPPLTLKRWIAMSPMCAAYGVHAALVLRALAALNVPMYNTLKRTTPVMVLIAKWCIERKAPNLQVSGSVVMVVAGCIIAGKGDLAFNPYAYTVALTCAAFQAAYILLTEYLPPPSLDSHHVRAEPHVGISMQPVHSNNSHALGGPGEHKREGVYDLGAHSRRQSISGDIDIDTDDYEKKMLMGAASPFQLQLSHALSSMADAMQYVPLTCIPFLLFWVLTTNQVQSVMMVFMGHSSEGTLNEVCTWLVAISSTEFLLMGTLTLCTQTNSALTTTIVGVLKGTLAVALGFVLLGGVGPTTPTNILGIVLNCLGGVWYAFAKYRESQMAVSKASRPSA